MSTVPSRLRGTTLLLLRGGLLYAVGCLLLLRSETLQGLVLYLHVINFPFWLHDTDYHALPEARTIQGR